VLRKGVTIGTVLCRPARRNRKADSIHRQPPPHFTCPLHETGLLSAARFLFLFSFIAASSYDNKKPKFFFTVSGKFHHFMPTDKVACFSGNTSRQCA
jgi:hypothetical protein